MFLYPWTVILLLGRTSFAIALRPIRQSGHLFPAIQPSYWDPGDTDVGVMFPEKRKLFNSGESITIFHRKKYTQNVLPHQFSPIIPHQSRIRLEEQPITETFTNMLVPDEQQQTSGNRANPSTKFTYYNNGKANAIAHTYRSNTGEAFSYSPSNKLGIKSEPVTPFLPQIQDNLTKQNIDNIRSSTTHKLFQQNLISKPAKGKDSRMETSSSKYFYYKHINGIDHHPKNIRNKYLPSKNATFPNCTYNDNCSFTGYHRNHTSEGIKNRKLDLVRGDIQKDTLKESEANMQRSMNAGRRSEYNFLENINGIEHYSQNLISELSPSFSTSGRNLIFPDSYHSSQQPDNLGNSNHQVSKTDTQSEGNMQRSMNDGRRSEYNFLENINGIEHYSQNLISELSPSFSTSRRNLIFPDSYHSSQQPDNIGNSNRQVSKTDTQTERSSTTSIQEDINSLRSLNTEEGNMQSQFPISDTPDVTYPVPNAYVVYVPEGIVVPKHKNFDQRPVYFDVEDNRNSERETTIITDQHTSQRVAGALLAYGPVGIVTANGMIPILSSDVTDTHPPSTTEAPNQTPSTTESGVDDTDIYIPGSKIITDIYNNGHQTSSTTPNTTQLYSDQDLEMLTKEMNKVTSGRRQLLGNQSASITQNKRNQDIHPIYEKGTILDVEPKNYFLTFQGIREYPPIVLDHHSLKHPKSVLTMYPGKKRRSLHGLRTRRPLRSKRHSRKTAQVHHLAVRSGMGKLSSRQNTIPASSPPRKASYISPSTSTTKQYNLKYQKSGLFSHDSEEPLVGNLGQFRNVRSLDSSIPDTNIQHEQIISSVRPQQMNTIPSSQMLDKVADELKRTSQRQKPDVNNNGSSSSTDGSQSTYSLPTEVNSDFLNNSVERNFGGNSTTNHFSSSLPGVTHFTIQNGADQYHKKMHLESKFSVHKGKQKGVKNKGLIKLGQLIYIKIDNSTCLNKEYFGDHYLNDLVDFIIEVTNRNIKARGKSNITIPDVNEEFSKTEFGIEVNGEFSANDGWFSDLSSLYRVANVVVSRSGNTLSMRFVIALRKIQFGFGRYVANLNGIGVEGQVNGEVKSNSMSVKVSSTINGDNTCAISLDDFKLNELGEIDLDITGLGALDWLVNKLSTWLIDNYKDDIIKKVQNEIMSQVNAVLSRVKC